MWPRLALLLGSSILLAGGGFVAGWKVQAWRHGAAETREVVRVVKVVEKQATAATAIAAHQAAVRTEIQWRTRILIEKAPDYVTPKADARCVVPVGFVRLHDAAAAGQDPVPDPAARADDAASGVALSAVGATVAGNYGGCRENAAKLTDLQAWLIQVKAAADAK